MCFLSAYLVGGLEGHLYPDLYDPNQLNVEHTVRVARESRDIVRGVKAHAEIGAGIKPTTLGADMHGYNLRVPAANDLAERSANPFFGVAPFNLHNAMSKILNLGMKLDEVIATVTANPAKMLGLSESLGSLQVGREADVAVLNLLNGRFDLSDNSGEHVSASEIVTPAFSLRVGRRYDVTSPLVPTPLEVAA